MKILIKNQRQSAVIIRDIVGQSRWKARLQVNHFIYAVDCSLGIAFDLFHVVKSMLFGKPFYVFRHFHTVIFIAKLGNNFKTSKEMAIKSDKRNYRVHNDKNKKLIKKSLEECGAGRAILLDNEESIIAGNGVYEQAEKLGIPVRIIETDGSELIALKRIDLATEDEKRKTLAMVDNHTSDTSEWDFDKLKIDFTPEDFVEWDFKMPDFGLMNEEEECNATPQQGKNQEISLGDAEGVKLTLTFNIEEYRFVNARLNERIWRAKKSHYLKY